MRSFSGKFDIRLMLRGGYGICDYGDKCRMPVNHGIQVIEFTFPCHEDLRALCFFRRSAINAQSSRGSVRFHHFLQSQSRATGPNSLPRPIKRSRRAAQRLTQNIRLGRINAFTLGG